MFKYLTLLSFFVFPAAFADASVCPLLFPKLEERSPQKQSYIQKFLKESEKTYFSKDELNILFKAREQIKNSETKSIAIDAALSRLIAEITGRPIPIEQQISKKDLDNILLRAFRNLALAYAISITNRFISVSKDEVEQASLIGIWNAIENYDYRRENMFSTYAIYHMKKEVMRQIAFNESARNLTNISEYARYRKTVRVFRLLTQRLGQEPTIDQVLEEYNRVGTEKVTYAVVKRLLYKFAYSQVIQNFIDDFETAVQTSDVSNTQIKIEDLTASAEETEVFRVGVQSILKQILVESELNPRQLMVLYERFGVTVATNAEGEVELVLSSQVYSLEDISLKLGITPERVRQIEVAILHKVRRTMRTRGQRTFDRAAGIITSPDELDLLDAALFGMEP